jgi:ADP-ribosylation factor related protein 1
MVLISSVGKIIFEDSQILLWDLGGQEELIPLWEKYYNECHAIMFVVDSTDQQRIRNVLAAFGKNGWDLRLMISVEKVLSSEHTLGIPVMMLANKQDQESAMQIHQIKELLNPVVAKFDARESNVLGTSALKG